MSKVICRASIALLLLAACFATTQVARAQIAPTNSATISGSVSDNAGKPVANAKVSLSGPKSASTQTDAQGLFVFVGVPFGTYQISAAAAGLGTATRSVSVQGDTNVAIQYESASMNSLKVIANVSTTANARFNITPASITQVSPSQAAFAGQTSWRTLLEQIPGVAQAGLGYGFSADAAYPNSPFLPVQISIDGALPYETATLLDDMPLIGSSFNGGIPTAGAGTSLSLYPLNGFGSADIIRGPGANAPTIVDSIGGSFVLHTPGVVESNHYQLSLSTDPFGGVVGNALAAVRWKKLSAVLTYGVNASPGPFSSAITSPSTYFNPATVNGMAFSCAVIGGINQCPSEQLTDGFYPIGYSTGLLTGGINLSTAWSQHSGSLALHYAFSPAVSADVFYAGQIQRVQEPEANYLTTFAAPPGYTGGILSGQYALNFGGFFLTPDATADEQVSSLVEEKITAKLGQGIFRIEALQNRTTQTISQATPSSLNVQLYGSGCLGSAPATTTCPSGGTYTIFNGTPYAATYPYLTAYATQWSNNRDILLSYTTSLGANYHAGASFVKSYYNIQYQNTNFFSAYDEVVNVPACSEQCGSETTQEARIFIGGNPTEKTSLDLSMYFANADYHVPANGGGYNFAFSFLGSTCYVSLTQPSAYTDAVYSYAAPRLGFVWRPTAAIAIRAAAGGGFAEAPLIDLLGSSSAVPSCVGGICSVSLANTGLQPEKSFSFDLGTDIRLRRNTLFSFDIYRSNLYGQVYDSTTTTGTCPTCGGEPLYVTQYGNLGLSRFEGVLLDVRHDVPHGAYWSLSGGLTRGYVVSVPGGFYNGTTGFPPTPCANCANLTVVPGINFNGTFAASIPYAQALGTLGYRWNPDKYVDLVGNYIGNNNTYFRPAFVELDGHVGYPLTKDMSLLMTFVNITGVYDNVVQTVSPANLSGAPAIAGPPAPLYGEEYGPQTVLLTTSVQL